MILDTEAAVKALFLPSDQPVLPLVPETKRPDSAHGLKDAVPLSSLPEGTDLGKTYGIRLDNLLVVDFDRLDFSADIDVAGFYSECVSTATWRVRTGGKNRGVHFLFANPENASGATKIRSISGAEYGEIKWGAGQYIVGPGSIGQAPYEFQNAAAPQPIPENVKTFRARGQAHKKIKLGDLDNNPGSDTPFGSTDRQRMLTLTGKLREAGLSSKQAATLALDIQSKPGVLPNFDPANPFIYSDLFKMAEEWEVNTPKTEPAPSTDEENGDVICMADLDYKDDPRQAFVNDMIYRGELNILYGVGGISKTGIMAKILADITSVLKLKVAIFIIEDRPEEFSKRFLASGGDPSLAWFVKQEDTIWHFNNPEHVTALKMLIEQFDLAAVYFDSIMDQHDMMPGKNVNLAEKTRMWAKPLAKVANETNCGILGTCHINKAGVLEGSQVLHSTARSISECVKDDNGKVTVTVRKLNKGKAGAVFDVTCVESVSANPKTGQPDMMFDAKGNQVPAKLWVCVDFDKAKTPGFSLASIPDSAAVRNHKRRVQELVNWFIANPGPHTQHEMIAANAVGKNFVLETLSDKSFKFSGKNGLTKFYELAP